MFYHMNNNVFKNKLLYGFSLIQAFSPHPSIWQITFIIKWNESEYFLKTIAIELINFVDLRINFFRRFGTIIKSYFSFNQGRISVILASFVSTTLRFFSNGSFPLSFGNIGFLVLFSFSSQHFRQIDRLYRYSSFVYVIIENLSRNNFHVLNSVPFHEDKVINGFIDRRKSVWFYTIFNKFRMLGILWFLDLFSKVA